MLPLTEHISELQINYLNVVFLDKGHYIVGTFHFEILLFLWSNSVACCSGPFGPDLAGSSLMVN